MGDDGSVVVVGGTGGDWDIPNEGSWDMAAFKLDASGTLVWKWQVTIFVYSPWSGQEAHKKRSVENRQGLTQRHAGYYLIHSRREKNYEHLPRESHR